MDLMPEKKDACFSPTLRGCVTPNARTARACDEIARLALLGVIANTYRSLIFEEEKALSAHFDALAIERLSHFRLIGRLTIAMGGEPVRCGALRMRGRCGAYGNGQDTPRLAREEIGETVVELRLWQDRLRALTAQSEDRVVCAVLEALSDDAERLAIETERFL